MFILAAVCDYFLTTANKPPLISESFSVKKAATAHTNLYIWRRVMLSVSAYIQHLLMSNMVEYSHVQSIQDFFHDLLNTRHIWKGIKASFAAISVMVSLPSS